jgi:predicted RNase H-like HicB family nuclease
MPSIGEKVIMNYQVFVCSQSEQHFVASVFGMPNLTVEGRTEFEAIAKAKAALEAQLAMGRFVEIEVNPKAISSADASTIKKSFYETATNEEWNAALASFINSPAFELAPPVSDEAISRESIYQEREDSQL